MRFKKPQVEEADINLTPMIDCLLFLVVFLLLSTTFSQFSQLNIVLPEAEGVKLEQKSKKIEVAVQSSGNYLVNGKPLATQNTDELITAIKQASGGDTSQVFVINADGAASHQAVVKAMDVAGKLGFLNLNISTTIPAE